MQRDDGVRREVTRRVGHVLKGTWRTRHRTVPHRTVHVRAALYSNIRLHRPARTEAPTWSNVVWTNPEFDFAQLRYIYRTWFHRAVGEKLRTETSRVRAEHASETITRCAQKKYDEQDAAATTIFDKTILSGSLAKGILYCIWVTQDALWGKLWGQLRRGKYSPIENRSVPGKTFVYVWYTRRCIYVRDVGVEMCLFRRRLYCIWARKLGEVWSKCFWCKCGFQETI